MTSATKWSLFFILEELLWKSQVQYCLARLLQVPYVRDNPVLKLIEDTLVEGLSYLSFFDPLNILSY